MRCGRLGWIVPAVAATVMFGASQGGSAASTFSVNPTQIYLSSRTTSALLTLRNQSTETLRFQLSVFAWTQSATGEMRLEPTQDINFFPTLLTLQPSEERRVRIGNSTPVTAHEKTYRIFVEELPPADRTQTGSGAVRVLTKMGIPIFLRPSQESALATLDDMRIDGNRLRFDLTNRGTVHFVPQAIRVRGLSNGAAVVERQVDGWYVLAGGRREFEMTLPEPACARVTSLIVDVEVGFTALQKRLETPAGACTP